jgi:hypothetical protein
MTLDSMTEQRSLRPRRPWVETLLLVGFLLFLFVGIVAFSAFFYLGRGAPPLPMNDPLLALQPERISPGLALQQLAGDPPAALAYQTLNAGELATSHAIVMFDTKNSGVNRAGLYGQLGQRLELLEAADEAAIAYNVSRALAVLDPSLPPLERSRQLTQAAEGFLAVDEPEAALDAARQAMLVGAKTPDLLPAQRQQIFAGLEPLAHELDHAEFSMQLADLLRNPFLTPTGSLLVPQMTTLAEPLAYDQPLLDAITARQLAARQLAERIRFSGGADIGPEQQALAAALLREDSVRRDYYQRMQTTPPTLGQQLWLYLDEYEWRALKVRIGLGGFGLSLVPEWESSTDGLLASLAEQAGKVDVAVKALASTLTDLGAQAMLEVEGQQWLALQAELGLYAAAPVADIGGRLQSAQQKLAQTGTTLALPIHYDAMAVPPGFRIQP